MALCLSAHMYASRGRLSCVGGGATPLSGHSPVSTPCPLCPDSGHVRCKGMSALGQLRTQGHLPAFSLCSTSHSLCSMPNIVGQAPNTTVTRSVVYETVTMYIPQREL